MLSNDWPRGTASYNNRQENLKDNYSLPAGTIINSSNHSFSAEKQGSG